jgi:hypothetical protein
MNASYKYLFSLTILMLVVSAILYASNHATNNNKPKSTIESANSSLLTDKKSNSTSSVELVSSSASSSPQVIETALTNPDVVKTEHNISHEEISKIEKKDDELTEEELERKQWALVKKYSSQLPTIYDNGKVGGRDVVGSSLEVMKKEADAGYRAAKYNYAAALLTEMLKHRSALKEEEIELWKKRLKEPYSYYRDAAIGGLAIAAIDLGCDYFLPPYSDELEGLTWILIGIKLGWSGICNYRMPSDEKIYMQALEQAAFYLDYYGFKTSKNNGM